MMKTNLTFLKIGLFHHLPIPIINNKMKAVILLVAILGVALSVPINVYADENKIKFSYDVHESSPVGLTVKGVIDPLNETQNKIQTFIRLANQYIPILEALAGASNELKYEYRYRINVAGFVFDVYVNFNLYVGWRVNPGGYTTDRFDVVYTPFVYGYAYNRINGTSFPAVGSHEISIVYAYAYAPIALQLFSSRKVCFQGSYVVEPVMVKNNLFAALNACENEIIDKVISGAGFMDFKCNYTNPVNITLVEKNFTSRIAGDFVAQSCFSF